MRNRRRRESSAQSGCAGPLLHGPVSSAIRDALLSTQLSARHQRIFVALGECLDGVAVVEPDPEARVLVGIALKHPHAFVACYDPADLASLPSACPKDGFQFSHDMKNRLAEYINTIVGRILHRNPDALAEILRLSGIEKENAALAIIPGKTDRVLVVPLPGWVRPFGKCAGAA